MSSESSPSHSTRRKFKRQESGSRCQNDECITKKLPKLPDYYVPNIDVDSTWYSDYMCQDGPAADSEKVHGLIVDFLISEGYREAAELLCAEAKTEFPEEEKAGLHRRYEIRTSIVNGDIKRAVEQIEDYTPRLLIDHPKVHFQLLRQQLVELIREKKIEEALEFAQKHLVHLADQPPELLQKLEQTYGLLVFDNPETSLFGFLMDMNQRNILAAEVNSLICGHGSRNPTSKLEQLFRLIVWNKHQLETKGEAISQPDNIQASKIARAIFCPDDDLHRSMANFL